MGDAEERTSLRDLALLFLRLGATSFGGPAAHIAIMHDEVVLRRRWLTEARFLDLLGAANLIPGPSSTELAIHIGWSRRRWAGLLVAGTCFIVPAMLLTSLCGWFYVRYGALPAVAGVLRGVKPVVVAVVVQAIFALAPKAAKTTPLRVLGALAMLAAALGAHELAVLGGAGLVALAARGARGAPRDALLLAPLTTGAVAKIGAASVTLPALFLVFAKIGAVLFGSGYVLLVFLRAELVERLGWLTEAQLVDAVAVGQLTPGPVFTTATFLGWVLAGPSGALVATAGIFLPAFVFVAASGPLVPRLRGSPRAAAFLDGVNVASLALMIVVTARIARAAIVDVPTGLLGIVAAALLLRTKVSSSWLVMGGAAIGFVLFR